MDLDGEKVRLLRFDGGFGPPTRIQRRCRVAGRTQQYIKISITIAMILSAIVTLALVIPVKQVLLALSSWIDAHPVWGAMLIPLMFCLAIPVAFPATTIEILSGSVFGLVQGALLNTIGKTCGSIVAFLIGKHLGKERLGSKLHTKFPMFTALSSVLEGSNWKPLLLIQLSSIPPVIKCYGLSITDVTLARFTITSLLGGIPNAFLWAYIGHQTRDIVSHAGEGDAGAVNTSRWSMLAIGLTCTVLAMGCLFVYTRRELRKQLHDARHKKGEDKASTSDEDSDGGESSPASKLVIEQEYCEVVVTQVAALDSPQNIAKRISFV